jgi:predicted O-linked N-acetylglucosamine transferase (SPINDLY family)
MKGEEAHSLIDGIMARMLGQPEWLTTHSVDEYVHAVVKLIDDPALRVQISRNILDKNPANIFFESKPQEFSKAFLFIHKNHELMRASGGKIFKTNDI